MAALTIKIERETLNSAAADAEMKRRPYLDQMLEYALGQNPTFDEEAEFGTESTSVTVSDSIKERVRVYAAENTTNMTRAAAYLYQFAADSGFEPVAPAPKEAVA